MPSKTLVCIYSGASQENLDFFSSKAKGGSNFSGLIYSRKILSGFGDIYGKIISIVIPPVSWWPKHSKLLFVKSLNSARQVNVYNVHFCNAVGIRNISIRKGISKIIKKRIPKLIDRNEQVDLLVFDAGYPQIDSIRSFKKIFPLTKATLIVPDLPELTGVSNRNLIYRFLKKIDSFFVYKKSQKLVDSFVFFASEMAKKFQIKNHPYIISEGVAGIMQQKNLYAESAIKTIVYTGVVSDYYANISLAIDSIEKVNKTFKTQFLIAGPCQDKTLLTRISESLNTKYLGTISPEEASSLQNKADVLLNLRPNYPDFKFSFPSKLIAYIQTGKPIVASRLDSIPKKYDDVLFYPKDLNSEEISLTILKALSLTAEEKESLYLKEARLIEDLSPQKIDQQIVDLFSKDRTD